MHVYVILVPLNLGEGQDLIRVVPQLARAPMRVASHHPRGVLEQLIITPQGCVAGPCRETTQKVLPEHLVLKSLHSRMDYADIANHLNPNVLVKPKALCRTLLFCLVLCEEAKAFVFFILCMPWA